MDFSDIQSYIELREGKCNLALKLHKMNLEFDFPDLYDCRLIMKPTKTLSVSNQTGRNPG